MGGKTSRVTYDQWDLMALAQALGISTEEAQQVYQDFVRTAGRDGKMSKSEFATYYKKFSVNQHQDSHSMKEEIARIFRTFDRDGSGGLSFEEFLSAVVMMNQNMPRRDRFNFVIRQNNPNMIQGDDRIPADYGQQVIQYFDNYYGSSDGSPDQRWNEIDRYNQGFASQDELVNYLEQRYV